MGYTWNYVLTLQLLVLDRNTWNHIIACKLLMLDRDTWNRITVKTSFSQKNRVFQEIGVQSQVESYQKTQKMILDAALLNTQHY